MSLCSLREPRSYSYWSLWWFWLAPFLKASSPVSLPKWSFQWIISVLSAHPLQVEVSPRVSKVERGSGLILTCRASGCLHALTLTWRRMNQNQTYLQRTQQEDGLSLLHLQDMDLQEQGGFSCEAECESVLRTRTTQVHVFCESNTPEMRSLKGQYTMNK